MTILMSQLMGIQEIYQQFITGLQQTGPLEFIAVLAGIIGVWFGAKENVLVYPIGLINTIVYIYISLKGHLFGEARRSVVQVQAGLSRGRDNLHISELQGSSRNVWVGFQRGLLLYSRSARWRFHDGCTKIHGRIDRHILAR